jgi:hypothetical protein
MKSNKSIWILLLALIVSIISFYIFYSNNLHIAYGDASSRLNISRKVVDNLTPGIAQLGNIWLPLPQLLMAPFIWNDYLWHSGIAGYLMSGIAFIAMVFYLYQFGAKIFESKVSGLLCATTSLININLLYMQTTAMSEQLFLSTVTIGTYFIAKWAKFNNLFDLMIAGVFISASTLTRYEGYFVFGISVLVVILISFIKYKKYKMVEGRTVLYTTLAITGIIMWALYSWVIFKDPFYWKGIYSQEKSIISTDEEYKRVIVDGGTKSAQRGNLVSAIGDIWTASAWMNGVVVVFFVTLATGYYVFYLFYKKSFEKEPQLFVALIPLGAILFVLFSIYSGGPPLNQPAINLSTLTDRASNYASEYNIRYGLNFFPYVAIVIGFLASKGITGKTLVASILSVQLITTFSTSLFTIYSLPTKLAGEDNISSNPGDLESSNWLKQNYDGGLIMISALKHDPIMFYLGVNYKNFIHEGAGKYWLTSRDEPQKYATWIFMFSKENYRGGQSDDSVTKYLADNPNLAVFYDLVYKDNTYEIYKLKDTSQLLPVK